RQVFQKKALVQRCMWHKRENVVSYLAKSEPGRGPRGDAHAPPARRLRAARHLVQDHQLHRIGERAGRGAVLQGRRVEDIEPTASLAGDRVARHRTATATRPRPSTSPEVAGRAAPRAQYQAAAESDGRGRVVTRWSRVDFQLEKVLTLA